MARDGSGDYSRIVTPPVNGDVADADDYNAELNDIATALSDSLNKSGTKALAANLPCGGFKLTGLGAGTSNGDSVRFEQLANFLETADIGVSVQAYGAMITAIEALAWSSGTPLIQVTAADTVSLTLTPSVMSLTLGLGAVGTPSLTFTGDTNTGFYSPAADQVAIALAGTQYAFFSTSFFSFASVLRLPAGSVSSVALCIRTADLDTGFYSIGTDNWGYSIAGTKYWDISASLFQISMPVEASTAVSSETTGALTSASRNRIVRCSGNITLPSSGMTDGDIILIDPRGTARTVTRPGSHTMYIANTDSATGTTGAHNIVLAVFHGSSKWTLQGSVS